MGVKSLLCEKRTSWLNKPEIVISDISSAFKEKKCSLELVVEGDKHILEITCGDCRALVKARTLCRTGMEKLGSIFREAILRGWGIVEVEITIEPQCQWMCKKAEIALFRGGG